MATLRGLHRPKALTAPTSILALALWLAAAGCHSDEAAAPAEGGLADARAAAVDLCDAFTGVGTACPAAGPQICFPMCEAGGCFCSDTADGPRWGCVTDRSCEPPCAPLDDACASDASGAPPADTGPESSADAGPE